METKTFKKQQSLKESFLSALKGIGHAFEERNFRIQAVIGAFAVTLAFMLELAFEERVVIIILTALVLMAETINSAFEKLLDVVIKEHHPQAAHIKELMAAAVFIFCLAALILGLWIFGRTILKA